VKELGVLFLILSTGAPLWCAEHTDGTASLSAQEIFSRLEKENMIRAVKLRSYSSVRRYSVFEKDKAADSEIKVRMDYVSPSTKKFRVLSQRGAGWIDRWVFRSLLRAELAAAEEKSKTASAITSANYETKLIGEAQDRGHDCYLLELHPKRRSEFLIQGKIWVDKREFAIVKLEGEPAKSFSFWVTRAHLVREYQKVGDFWLQQKDETHAWIRLVGQYIMQIEYGDYEING
jgi:outer membrane lipoprotein-sorting protein